MRLLKAVGGALAATGAAVLLLELCLIWPITVIVALVVITFGILVHGFYELQGKS